MKRRGFLKTAAGVCTASMLPELGCAHLAPKTTPAGGKRPNVLFIAVDDLNDWVGCLGGHPDARTPNIDRLAARGLLFERAYCPAPLCNASRVSLLTGFRPSTTGVYKNSHLWRKAGKLKDAVTLPRYFMDNGYHVVGGGKIFHGGQNDVGAWHAYFSNGRFPKPKSLPGSGIKGLGNMEWGPVDAPDGALKDTQVADWAARELLKRHDKPFFIACGFFRPHLPWYAPRKYFNRFPPDKITLPKVKADDLADVPPIPRRWANQDIHQKIVDNGKWREAVAAYLACGNYADMCIGRVLAALDKSPEKDNTIVVFWCDHGWHLAEKLHWKKFALWEEANRTPFIMVAPGTTKPGTRCARAVSLLDIYPTLIELCGLTAKPELDGVSLAPLLARPDAPREQPAVMTYQYGNHSVRSERWRYTRYVDGTEELYDHRKDPREWENLASRADLAPVKVKLARWLPKVNAKPAPLVQNKSKPKRRLKGKAK